MEREEEKGKKAQNTRTICITTETQHANDLTMHGGRDERRERRMPRRLSYAIEAKQPSKKKRIRASNNNRTASAMERDKNRKLGAWR